MPALYPYPRPLSLLSAVVSRAGRQGVSAFPCAATTNATAEPTDAADR